MEPSTDSVLCCVVIYTEWALAVNASSAEAGLASYFRSGIVVGRGVEAAIIYASAEETLTSCCSASSGEGGRGRQARYRRSLPLTHTQPEPQRLQLPWLFSAFLSFSSAPPHCLIRQSIGRGGSEGRRPTGLGQKAPHL